MHSTIRCESRAPSSTSASPSATTSSPNDAIPVTPVKSPSRPSIRFEALHAPSTNSAITAVPVQ
ncbi:MAG: hypothetical protein GIKADHBN_01082 [Phycisphaerales bacterium]|nr:hypothetical protein [Phycisphaerales bacterium]